MVEDLAVAYDGSRPVIEGINIRAREGEMVLLVGPNGGGKTTLIKTIAGLITPIRGRVLLLGRPPQRDLSVRKLIAYVPQNREVNIHAPLTVRDLVAFGRYPHIGLFNRLSKEDVDRIEKAIEEVGLSEKADKKLSELSGGQLSRAMIARALVQDARIYLMDEPFESIDNRTEEIIMEILARERQRGKLIIVTEHHIQNADAFDRVVMINRRILAEGKPADILSMSNGGVRIL